MSHFAVCVALGKVDLGEMSGIDLERALDPVLNRYYENPGDEYLKFTDETDQALANYQNTKITVVKSPDGVVRSIYDSDFRRHFIVRDGKILEKINDEPDKGVETERSRELELIPDYPVKDKYSFQEYCEDYCGYDECDGRWGYWTNPDAKWDWYSVGGRFSGAFLVDNELDKYYASENLADGEQFIRVDAARKGDIRWSEDMEQTRELEKLNYEKFRAAFATGNADDLGPLTSITPEGIMEWGDMIYKKGESLEEYMYRNGVAPDDRYLLNCYAFVDKEGAWHSLGDMGWFGMSANNKEERSWHDEVQNFLAGLDDEDILVMVDCHI